MHQKSTFSHGANKDGVYLLDRILGIAGRRCTKMQKHAKKMYACDAGSSLATGSVKVTRLVENGVWPGVQEKSSKQSMKSPSLILWNVSSRTKNTLVKHRYFSVPV